jgi:hypothetical protein
LTDHDVELVVLHRGIEISSIAGERRWISSMKSTPCSGISVSIPARSPGFSMTGPAVGLHRNAHLVADDVGERGLAETRGPIQQHVVERLAPLPRGRDGDMQVVANAILADVFVENRGRSPASNCASSSTRTDATTLRLASARSGSTRSVIASVPAAPPSAHARMSDWTWSAALRRWPFQPEADDSRGSEAPREVAAHTICAVGRRGVGRRAAWQLREPIPKLEDDPFRRLLANARESRSAARRRPRCTLVISSRGSIPGQHGDRQLGPMPLMPISFSKSCRSSSVRNPVQQQRILAHVRVDASVISAPVSPAS